MRNSFKTTINVTRGELCDLLMACTCAHINSGASKWKKLYDKLKKQLKDLDKQLDMLEYE